MASGDNIFVATAPGSAWPEDSTGYAAQAAIERRRVSEELDHERRENVRLRIIIEDARVVAQDMLKGCFPAGQRYELTLKCLAILAGVDQVQVFE